jgi:hypothetical protein
MLMKCTRSGGTTLWSVAEPHFGRRAEAGSHDLGIIGEGKICLILDTVDLGHVSYYKVLFDGQVGYVVSHSLKHVDDWTSDAL